MLFDQPEILEPNDVLDWHALCAAGLIRERQHAYWCLQDQNPLPAYLANALPVGATKAEIDLYFKSCQQELDLSTVLTLIAGAEARVRLDAQQRARSSANALAGRLALLQSQAAQDWGVPLHETGIMDAWKNHVGTLTGLSQKERDRILTAIGGFRDVLRVRHWVAHGRYWQLQRDIGSYPPATVAQTVTALYVALREIANHGGQMAFA
jgi:hypothetical protein